MTELSIGSIARRTGVKVPTIRYYEDVGLLPRPRRAANGRRVYDERITQRLAFIRHARSMDFQLEDIRALLELKEAPGRSCEQADAIAKARLADVEGRIARLTTLKDELQGMIAACGRNNVAQCRIMETIARDCCEPRPDV